ncbi:MAG: recombinase family protein [Pseudomonadota bacterium]
MEKAFCYLRVSGQGQLKGHGFDRQLDSIKTYCSNNGIQLVGTFKESVSGTSEETNRPEFRNMISEIMANGVRTIIVESLDRLARAYRIQEQLLIYLTSKNISLIAANTGEDVTLAISEDPMKKAMVQIQGIFAELDKSLLVKKLRKARDNKRAKTGKCEGRKSYSEIGKDILLEIKRLRRKAKKGGRLTFVQIAEKLNETGYTTTSGKSFTGANIQMILRRAKL